MTRRAPAESLRTWTVLLPRRSSVPPSLPPRCLRRSALRGRQWPNLPTSFLEFDVCPAEWDGTSLLELLLCTACKHLFAFVLGGRRGVEGSALCGACTAADPKRGALFARKMLMLVVCSSCRIACATLTECFFVLEERHAFRVDDDAHDTRVILAVLARCRWTLGRSGTAAVARGRTACRTKQTKLLECARVRECRAALAQTPTPPSPSPIPPGPRTCTVAASGSSSACIQLVLFKREPLAAFREADDSRAQASAACAAV